MYVFVCDVCKQMSSFHISVYVVFASVATAIVLLPLLCHLIEAARVGVFHKLFLKIHCSSAGSLVCSVHYPSLFVHFLVTMMLALLHAVRPDLCC